MNANNERVIAKYLVTLSTLNKKEREEIGYLILGYMVTEQEQAIRLEQLTDKVLELRAIIGEMKAATHGYVA